MTVGGVASSSDKSFFYKSERGEGLLSGFASGEAHQVTSGNFLIFIFWSISIAEEKTAKQNFRQLWAQSHERDMSAESAALVGGLSGFH